MGDGYTSPLMASSIRTELSVGASDVCPIAQASDDTDTPISYVARSSVADSDEWLTEEFATDADTGIEHSAVETVFEFDSRNVYRFERRRTRGCVCECIERHGCPVSDIRARDGTLFVSFYAPDIETVQEIVNDLHERFDGINVRQLTQADDGTDHEFVFVDRNRLTDRQREVLETSFEMGYFDFPKGANAGEVADELDIAPSTFSEHLAAAQRKLLETVLDT